MTRRVWYVVGFRDDETRKLSRHLTESSAWKDAEWYAKQHDAWEGYAVVPGIDDRS